VSIIEDIRRKILQILGRGSPTVSCVAEPRSPIADRQARFFHPVMDVQARSGGRSDRTALVPRLEEVMTAVRYPDRRQPRGTGPMARLIYDRWIDKHTTGPASRLAELTRQLEDDS
jgi:hypothetical protein